MRINDLSEGIIQVPDELTSYVMMITSKFLKGYLYCNFHKELITNLEKRIGFISSNKQYLVCDIEESSGEFYEYDVDVSDIKYTDKSTDTLGIGIAYQNSSSNAMYLPDKNSILINLFKFIEQVDNLKQDSEDSEELMMRYELVDAENRITELYNSFLSKLKGIVKHELAHFIQFQYLEDKSKEQVDTSGDYHQQFVEYSPWIISTIETVNLAKDEFNTKELISYITAIIDEKPKGLLFSEHGNSIENSHIFFRKLKNNKPSQWKKAIKYLIKEL